VLWGVLVVLGGFVVGVKYGVRIFEIGKGGGC
jgi:hypothetical protein